MGNEMQCFHRNLSGGGDKNPGSTNEYTKFGQLLIRKITKIIATRCHISRLKCTKFNSWCLSVCVLDGVFMKHKSKQNVKLYSELFEHVMVFSSKRRHVRHTQDKPTHTTKIPCVDNVRHTKTTTITQSATDGFDSLMWLLAAVPPAYYFGCI